MTTVSFLRNSSVVTVSIGAWVWTLPPCSLACDLGGVTKILWALVFLFKQGATRTIALTELVFMIHLDGYLASKEMLLDSLLRINKIVCPLNLS